MFSRAWLALCGATTIAAQTAQNHVGDSPFLNQWFVDSGYVSISTAGSDATHTTYIVKCENGFADICTLPAAGATIVTGLSSVACSYTDPSEPLYSSVGCNYIDSGSSAVCTEYQSGQSGTYVATFSDSMTLPAYAVALGFNTVGGTETAGATPTEASAGNTASVTTGAATATATATTTAGTLSSTEAAATTESATKTGSAASETKTGGAAETAGLGNAHLVAGAVALGLRLMI
ncbi:hypothetical protein N7490_007714 [Penicillium lividum]|nr:hypothetical protein N7490_007714 [Penicillium lividum]